MECSDIGEVENGMENENANQIAVIFTKSIPEFITTHGWPQKLLPLTKGIIVVSFLVI